MLLGIARRDLARLVAFARGPVESPRPASDSLWRGPFRRFYRHLIAPVEETRAYPWACPPKVSAGSIHLSTQKLPALDLAAVVQRIGHAELVRDDDGVVRRVPLLRQEGDSCYPSFALQVACADLGVAPSGVRRRPGAIELWRDGVMLRRIPVGRDGCMLVNYRDREPDAEPPLALVDVPFLCHYRRACELVHTYPYKEIANYCKVHRDQVETVFATLAYFDGMNFAAHAACPALFSVALMDDTCPPSTVFAAYNHYAGPKQIQVWPYNQHEGGESFQNVEKLKFLKDLIWG